MDITNKIGGEMIGKIMWHLIFNQGNKNETEQIQNEVRQHT